MGVGGLVLLFGVGGGTAAGVISLYGALLLDCPGALNLPSAGVSESWVCRGSLAAWLTELKLILAALAALAPVAGALYSWHRSEWTWLTVGIVMAGVAVLGVILLASGQEPAIS